MKFYYLDSNEFLTKNFANSCNIECVSGKVVLRNPTLYTNSCFVICGMRNLKYADFITGIGSTYFYIDTGYFGNNELIYRDEIRFYRVCKNDFHYTFSNDVSHKRLRAILKYLSKTFNLDKSNIVKNWRASGKHIILCHPSVRYGVVFQFDIEKWISETIREIKEYSDREIIVRSKFSPVSLSSMLEDAHALVTHNSIAAVEANMYGVPTFTTGPGPASPVSLSSLADIENPIYPDRELWMQNLAANQFHIDELRDGTVYKHILNNLK